MTNWQGRAREAALILAGVFLGAALAELGGGIPGIRASRADSAAKRSPSKSALVGQRISLDGLSTIWRPSVLPASRGRIAPPDTAVWILNESACMVCMAEVAEWRSIAEKNPNVEVILVGLGADTALFQRFGETERLPFEVRVGSADHALGGDRLATRAPLRLYMRNGTVLLAWEGRDDDGRFFTVADLIASKAAQ